eukprot:375984_1
MAHTQAEKLKALQQAFVTADKDGDSLLSKTEFKEFVEIGYHKQCPPGMYESLCTHFSRDPNVGIDWNTARAVWVQAQGPSRSKSPPPPPQQQSTANKAPMNGTVSSNIKQAFIECDKDCDGLLNKEEFISFVHVGFKKPTVPKGMYEQVCKHFKKDAGKGLDWLSAYSLWKQSNNNTPSAAPQKKNKTPPPPKSKGANVLARPPQLKRVGTAMHVPMSKLSPAKSTGQLTEQNLRALDKHSKSVNNDDENGSEVSDSYTSSSRRHRRIASIAARGAGDGHRASSFDYDGPDASEMVVQMMETKVKNLQSQLKLERTKRKKTEELAQSLLTSNEEYKKQIGDLSSSTSKYRSENKTIRDELRKAKQIVDDDRNTIRHLKEQRQAMKKERDEAYTLIDKMEKKYEMTLKKERQKHKNEVDKLSAGFLQSLGAEPGKDVTTVIKELKQRNVALQANVDTLAETLARKQQSLLQALEAMDNIAMEDEKQQYPADHHLNTKVKQKLKQFNERRKSFGHALHLKKDDQASDSDVIKTGLPKPPKRRNSQVGIKPHHRPTATFFKRAVGDQPPLDMSSAKNGKELQFVSQQLTNDVANKTQSIQNLEMANTALMQQMQKMQKQMKQMEQNSQHNINDLP